MCVRESVCVCVHACVPAKLFIEMSLGAPWCGADCTRSAFELVYSLCTWLYEYFLFFLSHFMFVCGKWTSFH